jgi:hypothetical protein
MPMAGTMSEISIPSEPAEVRSFDRAVVFGPRVIRSAFIAAIVLASVVEAIDGPPLPSDVRVQDPSERSRGVTPPPPRHEDTSALSTFGLRLFDRAPHDRPSHSSLGGVSVRIVAWRGAVGNHMQAMRPAQLVLPSRVRSTSLSARYAVFAIKNDTALAVTKAWVVVMHDGVSVGERCIELLVPESREFEIPRGTELVTMNYGLCRRPGALPSGIRSGRAVPSVHLYRVDFSDGTSLVAE